MAVIPPCTQASDLTGITGSPVVFSKAEEDALCHPTSDVAWRNSVGLLLKLKYQLQCKSSEGYHWLLMANL